MSLSLDRDWRDEALNTWCYLLCLFALLFDRSSDNVRCDGIAFVKGKQFTDVVCSFWPKSSWDGFVGQTGDFSLSLLDDDQVEDGKIVVDDAATDRLSFTLTGTAGAITFLTLVEEQLNSTNSSDT